MNFALALIKNENQVELLTFANEGIKKGQIIDIEEFKSYKVDTILYSKDLESEELLSFLNEEYKFCPIRQIEEFKALNYNINDLNEKSAFEIISKSLDSWIIQNNLDLLQNLFPTLNHLKELWPNDRTSFMEELWFILKKNLGSFNLTMIYNSLKRGEGENEKNKLVQSKIEGDRYPETFEGKDFEAKVIAHYKSQFSDNFEISEYSKTKKELVATIQLKGSPLIIMAKVNELTRLQQSLISTLFAGLQK